MANITIHFVRETYDYVIPVVNIEMESLSVLNTALRAEMGRILIIKFRTEIWIEISFRSLRLLQFLSASSLYRIILIFK